MIALRDEVWTADVSRSEKGDYLQFAGLFAGLGSNETSQKEERSASRRETEKDTRDRAQLKPLNPGHYADFFQFIEESLNFGQVFPQPLPSPALVEPLAPSEEIQRESLREELFSTETHEEVLTILVQRNLSSYVEDYKSYLDRRQEELEEGESPGIILQSLQSWAWFAVSYAEPKNLPCAKFRADFDGCIELIWRLYTDPISNDADNEYWGNGRGIAVLRFYPSYLNSLSILSGPYASEKLRLSLESCLSHEKTQQTIDIFSERFLNAGA